MKYSIKSNFLRVWKNLTKQRKINFFVLLILMILASFMDAVGISAVLPFIGVLASPSKVFEHEKAQYFIGLLNIKSANELGLPVTIMFIIIMLVGAILRMSLLFTQTKFSYDVMSDFSRNIYLRTLYQPFSVHISRNSSEIITGVTRKANDIMTGLITPLMNIGSYSVNALAIVVTLFIIDPIIAFIAFFGFGTLYYGIIKVVKGRLAKNSEILNIESVNLVRVLQEGLGGIRDIILDGTQHLYGKIFNKSLYSYNKSLAYNQIVANSPRIFVEFLGISFITILAYKMSLNMSGFVFMIPTLAALTLGSQRLLPALQNFYSNWVQMKASQSSVFNGLELLEQTYPKHALFLNPPPIRFDKFIKFENISFRYTQEGTEILNNINLTLEKGKKYGFVGATGCGKSTLVDVIMGLLVPTKGHLKIDNSIIDNHNYRSWQVILAHVPQSIYLSDTSIAENIAFGVEPNKINMAEVREAAKKAQISETIEALPQKYDTFVGERGIRLSGGQRQRIGIARALYKNAQVIVFDEATSALDNETELAVMEGIEKLADDLTILIVAHRVSTLKHCDKIFRMVKGEVIEEGLYAEIVNQM
jgi:ABC-type multidrug transport system fused ATPase/permease subunit